MKRLLPKTALALLALVLPQLAVSVSACSCMPLPTPYEAFREATVVFAGKVVSSNVPPDDQLQAQGYTLTKSVFRFAVEESFKGVRTAEVEISAGSTGTSCYAGFKVGASYLVYGYTSAGSSAGTLPYAGTCTRTTGLRWAQDDIHYLRSMLKGASEPRVYGSLARIDNDLSKPQSSLVTPLEGIKIVVEGEKRRFEAVTDKQGLFSLDGIPDGEYKVRPVLPDKYTSYWPGEEVFILGRSIEWEYQGRIREGTSAYARFHIGWNNEISGKVLDAEGNPITRAKPSLLFLNGTSDSPLIAEEEKYDLAEGKYRFSGLLPGRYIPAVTIEAPFKTGRQQQLFYYPSAVSPSQASEIEVKESESLTNRDIMLPAGYVTRPIEGVLVWPDGRPVANAWVTLAGRERLGDEDKRYDFARADEQGRFSVQGFVGAEYWVHASVGTHSIKLSSGGDLSNTGVSHLEAKPLKVTLGRTNERLRIVIPLPEGVRLLDEKH